MERLRRIIWKQGCAADNFLAINLIKASRHATSNGTRLGVGYNVATRGLQRASLWRPPVLVQLQIDIQRHVAKHQNAVELRHGRKRRAEKAEGALVSLPMPAAEKFGSSVVAQQLRPLSGQSADKCHFGHTLARTTSKEQDLVPRWRGAPFRAPLCYRCYRVMLNEMQSSDIPLEVDKPLSESLRAPEHRPHGTFVTSGPCHFGHRISFGQQGSGCQVWHWHAHGDDNLGVPSMVTLCNMCWRRVARGKPPRHANTAASSGIRRVAQRTTSLAAMTSLEALASAYTAPSGRPPDGT